MAMKRGRNPKHVTRDGRTVRDVAAELRVSTNLIYDRLRAGRTLDEVAKAGNPQRSGPRTRDGRTVAEVADAIGVSRATIYDRLRVGRTLDEIANGPAVLPRRGHRTRDGRMLVEVARELDMSPSAVRHRVARGMTLDELEREFRTPDGRTVADVAKEHGTTPHSIYMLIARGESLRRIAARPPSVPKRAVDAKRAPRAAETATLDRAALARLSNAVAAVHERWNRQRGDSRGRRSHTVTRCLVLLALIAEKPAGFTAEELMHRTGESLETVRRDIAALERAGVAVKRARGREGRWRLA